MTAARQTRLLGAAAFLLHARVLQHGAHGHHCPVTSPRVCTGFSESGRGHYKGGVFTGSHSNEGSFPLDHQWSWEVPGLPLSVPDSVLLSSFPDGLRRKLFDLDVPPAGPVMGLGPNVPTGSKRLL